FYLFISLFVTLGLSVLLTGTAAAQKEKAKEKARTQDAQTKVESETPQVFTLSAPGGTGSYLGVYLEEVTPDRVKELGLSEERGAIITKVVEGGPAEKAGLKVNDVVVSFNERRIDSVRELQRLLSETPPDRNIKIEVVRGGSRQTLAATLSKRASGFAYTFNAPEWNGQAWAQTEEGRKRLEESQKQMESWRKQYEDQMRQHQDEFKNSPDFGNFTFVNPGGFVYFSGSRLGISAESLTDQLAEYFGVKDGHGVLVASVNENSAAARAGLKAGDVITAVDEQKIDSINELVTMLAKKEGAVTLKIIRNKAEQSLTVTLEKRGEAPAVRRGTTVRAMRSV
ncbi:MAG TPA: PDZ domain-containing protein, partial [Blastocatellia bacterium]|nr:PDZ domain-containing protein [Blastocatellia bacterium]